jgi:hypothetical protein
LESWKSESCHVVKSSNQANKIHVNHWSTFWLLQKVIHQRVKRTSYKGYIAFIEIQLSFMAAWKKGSLRVLRPPAQGYVANCERLNGFVWPKYTIHCTSWNPCLKFHGPCESIFSNSVDKIGYPRGMRPSPHSINSDSVRHFGGLKVRFFKVRETLDPLVSGIHKASVRPADGLTMRFFKGHETLSWRLHVFRWATLRHFGILKRRSCRIVKSSIPGQLASCQPLLDILITWKCVSTNVYWILRSRVSCFHWDTIKYYGDQINDSLIFLRSSAHGYEGNFERIIGIFWPNKPIHCTSWNPCLKVHGLF